MVDFVTRVPDAEPQNDECHVSDWGTSKNVHASGFPKWNCLGQKYYVHFRDNAIFVMVLWHETPTYNCIPPRDEWLFRRECVESSNLFLFQDPIKPLSCSCCQTGIVIRTNLAMVLGQLLLFYCERGLQKKDLPQHSKRFVKEAMLDYSKFH